MRLDEANLPMKTGRIARTSVRDGTIASIERAEAADDGERLAVGWLSNPKSQSDPEKKSKLSRTSESGSGSGDGST